MGKPNPINSGPIVFAPPIVFISFVDIAALWRAGIIKMLALPTILENGYVSLYLGFKATSGCISPSKSKSTFLFFKSSIACLTCSVFLDVGFPKVEWDKKATLGSKPNNLATLTLENAIFTKFSAVGKSFTCVSAINIVFLV